jgi:prepilin-type N-terminal cleavage/methylation domain-containing protein
MQNKSAHRHSGFTLIEVLVVIMIITITSIVGAMNYSRYKERNTLENAAERLISEIKSAKTYAINGGGGQDVTLRITSNPGVYNANPIAIIKSPALTETSFTLPNRTRITCPRFSGGPNNNQENEIIFLLRTGEAIFPSSLETGFQAHNPSNPNSCPASIIRLKSTNFYIDITLDHLGYPTLGDPLPRIN